jgi:hypothetical protein
VLFIVGIISHRAFCVRTTVDKWVFPKVWYKSCFDDEGLYHNEMEWNGMEWNGME